MKYINYLYMAASVLAVAACNNEQMPEKSEGGLPINIVTNAEDFSRAATQATTIAAGEKVYVFADYNSNNSKYFGAWELNSDGAGKLTSTVQKNYPDETLNFYGIHGNFESAPIVSDSDFPASITHTVKTDQTNSGNYCVSDLLYSVNKGVASSTNPLSISFYHLLSKVEVALIPGNGFTEADLDGATVKILNTVNTVKFTPSKEVDMTVQSARASMLSVEGIETKAEINVNEYGEAIVVPQTVAANTDLIEIKLNGNTYKVTPTAASTFESGKKYTYNLTISSYGLTVTSSVTDWTSKESSGSAIKYIGDVMPEDAQIGDFYMNDGSLVSGSATLTDAQKAACIGIVFQTDINRIGDAEKEALAAKGVKPHGLVMALKNEAGSVEAAKVVTTIGEVSYTGYAWGKIPDNGNTKEISAAARYIKDCYNDISGLKNSQEIWAKINGNNTDNYIPFRYAKDFSSQVIAPENTTGWFLPSIGQYWDIFRNLGKCDFLDGYKENEEKLNFETVPLPNGKNDLMTQINSYLDKIGGSYIDRIGDRGYETFWTSSEYGWDYVVFALFSNTELKIRARSKQEIKDNRVRCILAF